MKLHTLARTAERFLKSNSPAIFAAVGVGGLISTAVLSAKAGYQSASVLCDEEDLSERQKAELTWKLYIPAIATGAASTVCIIASTRLAHRKTAAALTAYSVTERAYHEYKDKVLELYGENKEQAVRDGIAQDQVKSKPPPSQEILVTGDGAVLCRESYTGRYFASDMQTLRKARNDINARIMHELYVTLDDFYQLVGLSSTTSSNDIGWDSDKLMELEFSSVLTEDDRPCLAFEYNYTKPI